MEETLNTLKFVERARQVVTEVVVKTYENRPEVKELQEQVNYLKGMLKVKRRNSEMEGGKDREWEKEKTVRWKERIERLEDENRKLKERVREDWVEGEKGLVERLR